MTAALQPLPAQQGPIFANEFDFFKQYVRVVFARPSRDHSEAYVWCPRWYDHVEAHEVMRHMHSSYERFYAMGGDGLATWMVAVAYPLMDRLWDREGTFKGCEKGHHPKVVPLPHEPF
jgi:hypothetical protein